VTRAQRLVDEFEQGRDFAGGFSIRHGIAAVCATWLTLTTATATATSSGTASPPTHWNPSRRPGSPHPARTRHGRRCHRRQAVPARWLASPTSRASGCRSINLSPRPPMTDHFSLLHEEYAERMTAQAFDDLVRRITRPGRYCPKVAKVLSTPAPWDNTCDKTSTPENQ
jgi:hypothetical protein